MQKIKFKKNILLTQEENIEVETHDDNLMEFKSLSGIVYLE